MPYPGLQKPELLPLQKSTADPYHCRRHQTQFCLSLCGVSGSRSAQGWFEPSEHLWQVRGFTATTPALTVLLEFLCPWTWVSPNSCSRATQTLLQGLPFPSVRLSHQEAPISLLSFSIRGKTDWKSQTQKTNQSDCMDNSSVQFSSSALSNFL